MAKLKDLNIVELSAGETIHLKTPVSVTQEGLFTTTLPADALEKLNPYGVPVRKNRLGNPGYFEADTLAALENEIHKFVKECISRELVEDKLVIKYKIATVCAYVRDEDGETVPNGSWVKDHKAFEEKRASWIEGTASRNNRNYIPSFSVFAQVYHKKTYAYRSGLTITVYEEYKPPRFSRSDKAVDWLNSQVEGLKPDVDLKRALEWLPEVDATEENAVLFVSLIKLIWQANELFSRFMNPGALLEFLRNNKLQISLS